MDFDNNKNEQINDNINETNNNKANETNNENQIRLNDLQDLDSLPSSADDQPVKPTTYRKKRNSRGYKSFKIDTDQNNHKKESLNSKMVQFKTPESLFDNSNKSLAEKNIFLSEPASDEFITFSSASAAFDTETVQNDVVLHSSLIADGAILNEDKNILENNNDIKDDNNYTNENTEENNFPKNNIKDENISKSDFDIVDSNLDSKSDNINISPKSKIICKLEIEKKKCDEFTQKRINDFETLLESIPARRRYVYVKENYDVLKNHFSERILEEIINFIKIQADKAAKKTKIYLDKIASCNRIEFIKKNYDDLLDNLSPDDLEKIIDFTNKRIEQLKTHLRDKLNSLKPREALEYLLKNYDNYTKVISNGIVDTYVEQVKEKVRELENEEKKKEIIDYLHSLPLRKRVDYVKLHYDTLSLDLGNNFVTKELKSLEESEKECEMQLVKDLDNKTPKDRIEYLKNQYSSLIQKISTSFIEEKINESKDKVKTDEISEKKKFIMEYLNSLQPRKRYEYILNQKKSLIEDLDSDYINEEIKHLEEFEAAKKLEIKEYIKTLNTTREKFNYILSNYENFSDLVSHQYLEKKIKKYQELIREERRVELKDYLNSLAPKKCVDYIESHRDVIESELGEEYTTEFLSKLNMTNEKNKRELYEKLGALSPNDRLEYLFASYKELSETIDERFLDRNIEATKEDLKILQEEDVKKKSQTILSTLTNRKKLEYLMSNKESLSEELGKSYINSEIQALKSFEDSQKNGILTKLKNKSPSDAYEYLLSKYIELSELLPKEFLDELIDKYKEESKNVDICNRGALEDYLLSLPNRKRLEFILAHYNYLSEDLGTDFIDSEIQQLTELEKEEEEKLTKTLASKLPNERLDYIITHYKSLSDEISEECLNRFINTSKEQARKQDITRKSAITQNYLKNLSPRKRHDYISSHFESLAEDLDRDYLNEQVSELITLVECNKADLDVLLKELTPRQQFEYLRLNFTSLSEQISEDYIDRLIYNSKNEADIIENEENVLSLKSYITLLSPNKKKEYINLHYLSLEEDLGIDYLVEAKGEVNKIVDDKNLELANILSTMESKEALNYLQSNFNTLTESVPADVINSYIKAQNEKIKLEETEEKKKDFETHINSIPLRHRSNFITTNYKRLTAEFDPTYIDEKVEEITKLESDKKVELDKDIESKNPKDRYYYLLENYNELTDYLENDYIDSKIEESKEELKGLQTAEKKKDMEQFLVSLQPRKRRTFVASHYDLLSSEFGNAFVESELQSLDESEKIEEQKIINNIKNMSAKQKYDYLITNYQKLSDYVNNQFIDELIVSIKEERKNELENIRKTYLLNYMQSLSPFKRREYINKYNDSLNKDFGQDPIDINPENIDNEIKEAEKQLLQKLESMNSLEKLEYLNSGHNHLHEIFGDEFVNQQLAKAKSDLETQDTKQKKEHRKSFLSSLSPKKKLLYFTSNFDDISKEFGETYVHDEIQKLQEQSKIKEEELDKHLISLSPSKKLQYLLDNYSELSDLLNAEVLDSKLEAAGEEAEEEMKAKEESEAEEKRKSQEAFLSSLSHAQRREYIAAHFDELSVSVDTFYLDSEVETGTKTLDDNKNNEVIVVNEQDLENYDDLLDTASSQFQESYFDSQQEDNDDDQTYESRDMNLPQQYSTESDSINGTNREDEPIQNIPSQVETTHGDDEINREIPDIDSNIYKDNSMGQMIKKLLDGFKPRHKYDYILKNYDTLKADLDEEYLKQELEAFTKKENQLTFEISTLQDYNKRKFILENFEKISDILGTDKTNQMLAEIPQNIDNMDSKQSFVEKIASLGPHSRTEYLESNREKNSEIYGKDFIDLEIEKSKKSEEEAQKIFYEQLVNLEPSLKLSIIAESYKDLIENLGPDFIKSEILKESENAKEKELQEKEERARIISNSLANLPVKKRLDYIQDHYNDLSRDIEPSKLDSDVSNLKDEIKENESKLLDFLYNLKPTDRLDKLLTDYITLSCEVSEEFLEKQLDEARNDVKKLDEEYKNVYAQNRLNRLIKELNKMSPCDQKHYLIKDHDRLIKEIDNEEYDKLLKEATLQDNDNKDKLYEVLEPMNPAEKRKYLTENYNKLCDTFNRSFIDDIIIQNRSKAADFDDEKLNKQFEIQTMLYKLSPQERIDYINANKENINKECYPEFSDNELNKAESALEAEILNKELSDPDISDSKKHSLSLKLKLLNIKNRQLQAMDQLSHTNHFFPELEENCVRTRRSLKDTMKPDSLYDDMVQSLKNLNEK